MLPEIISFNKSMEFRREEYEQLLEGVETPCFDIVEIWGSLLSDLAVIGLHWQALWILSEKNCKKYDLLFPTAVIVRVSLSKTDVPSTLCMVNEIKYTELAAAVSVIAVQEDILLPSILDVPIIELHPIKVQDYDETDLKDIEDWFDKCRYFFKNLWYPWDAKLEISLMDWCKAHLENRLKMQYDLKHGVFDKTIANYLKLLLAEAQSISFSNEEDIFEEDKRISAVAKYIHRENLKTELDLFEEPYLRYGIIQLKKKERRLRNSFDTETKEAKLIWVSGTCECLLQCVLKAQSLLNKNTSIKVFGSLQEALDSSEAEDIIILPPGEHALTSLRGIEGGGTIKGWNRFETKIMPEVSVLSRAIMFECFGYVELENLTLTKSSGIIIQVFNNTVKLTRCRLISEKNSTSRGIVVVSGNKLILEKCEIVGFGTGIIVQAKAQAFLMESEIKNCYEGIKIIEGAVLSLDSVNVCFCATYGIRVESSQVESEMPVVGDLNLLEGDRLGCQISVHLVNLGSNLKGNVIIKQIERIFYVEELSESYTSNEVVCVSDEETFGNDSVEIV